MSDEFDESGELAIYAPGYPVMLPPPLIEDSTRGCLTDGAFVTYAFMVNLHDGFEGVMKHSYRQLAELRGISARTLRRHLADLQARGWAEKNERGVLVILRSRAKREAA